MFTLRLTQEVDSQSDSYSVKVALERSSQTQEYVSHFVFQVKEQEQENIRWYLEDFLKYPQEPAPKIAAKIEQRMAEIGIELFEKVFLANSDIGLLWEEVRDRLNETRVEIISGVTEATTIPWELMRDPETNMPLALAAKAFVRKPDREVADFGNYLYLLIVAKLLNDKYLRLFNFYFYTLIQRRIRILLVICRPKGENDVAFRSMATKLIKGLTQSGREIFQLEVLRPPNYEQLESVLEKAKEKGKPYDIVHFDGHGTYEDIKAKEKGKPPKKKRGYLIFENPKFQEKKEPVLGKRLGKLLKKTGVSLLLLNACRSAYAEVPTEPGKTLVDQKAQAYETLAQDVMNAGVAGVVAMRYNLLLVTAPQFVADLYAALAQGQTLGEAVTQGRKQLNTEQMREINITSEPQELQDWTVPIVYEVAPIAPFRKFSEAEKQPFNIRQNNAAPTQVKLDEKLPINPDTGFFGRDETLLTLDRAFDTKKIVLLHSYAGNGKTSVAAEFGRWYAQTGGVTGWVLFTSFEQHMSLAKLINKIGQNFKQLLEKRGIDWLALSDEERQIEAVEVLREHSVLWIWDNVEPVAGFPAGTESDWSKTEREKLVKFLQDVTRETETKFLLTSRRNEQGWLGDLPHRITMPAMLIPERVELARALAEQQGHHLSVIEWLPLLQFSMGNPLTIRVLVGQALLYGLRSKEQIEDFVAKLRLGEGVIDDEREGRSSSLGASLSYGFEQAFTEQERQQLALLHLFQGFVNVDVLCWMGEPDTDWCIPALRGLTHKLGMSLLDRAADIGLLATKGNGFYFVHPAIPWYFKSLFEEYYPNTSVVEAKESKATLATRAFVQAMGDLGDYCYREYDQGNRQLIIGLLTFEEANLLHARQISLAQSWPNGIVNPMQGIKALYEHTGRWSEWGKLVEEILPEFVDAATDSPLPGREILWILVTEYRVKFAITKRQWEVAERLQRLSVDEARKRAAQALAISPETLNSSDYDAIRTLAVALSQLGDILRDKGKPECIAVYEEDYNLSLRIGDTSGAAVTAINIRKAIMSIPAIRDLAKAEIYKDKEEVLGNESKDPLVSAGVLAQQGHIEYERCQEAIKNGKPEEEQLRYLNSAKSCFEEALDCLPEDAYSYLALVHNQLGNIYAFADPICFPVALNHWQKSIQYEEMQGNIYQAARTRFNVAINLFSENRPTDALLYAQEALENYQIYGDSAVADIEKTVNLIQLIQQNIQNQGD